MSYENSVAWIAFAADMDAQILWDKFAAANVPKTLVNELGNAIAGRPRIKLLANPPEDRTYRPRPYTFVCECGCGETVTISYVTGRKPKYKNPAHRERVYRRNRAARQ